jgi:hypothetical protein
MPIDRPDGRHWCAPDQETPDNDGVWVCACDKSWSRVSPFLWMPTEDVPAWQAAQDAAALTLLPDTEKEQI